MTCLQVHNYQTSSTWPRLFTTPSQSLPVIVGEFGPDTTFPGGFAPMEALPFMQAAETAQVTLFCNPYSPVRSQASSGTDIVIYT